jgi:hypothetical protein
MENGKHVAVNVQHIFCDAMYFFTASAAMKISTRLLFIISRPFLVASCRQSVRIVMDDSRDREWLQAHSEGFSNPLR